jgi:hypothetical protein
MAFADIVPPGLAVAGNTVSMARAGPVLHLPQAGRVVSFQLTSAMAPLVASGARLLVDVEFGRGRTLFALAQGVWNGVAEGSPAVPNTGTLLEVNPDTSFTVAVDGLNQPTSGEFIGNTAFAVSLAGAIGRIHRVSPPPYGMSR